ncbi:hypothetical protein BU23DRAFT_16096 [Bimuria novae-zelandiae CBS 107.79]|uniref:Uncharacterized protein n=1 Tax=Bimuria novae-zelandiae CBS 107.79 TaxID=1447943 RepID=A0A6A5VJY8_9PLEO|nr:hypothetical protein BU23DRAFT_16096 [Bimuria novae-zelandiae CBS 107.79]
MTAAPQSLRLWYDEAVARSPTLDVRSSFYSRSPPQHSLHSTSPNVLRVLAPKFAFSLVSHLWAHSICGLPSCPDYPETHIPFSFSLLSSSFPLSFLGLGWVGGWAFVFNNMNIPGTLLHQRESTPGIENKSNTIATVTWATLVLSVVVLLARQCIKLALGQRKAGIDDLFILAAAVCRAQLFSLLC